MSRTLKQLSNDTFNYLNINQGVNEFDKSINDISREMIFAMKQEKGTCFLGKINLYGEESKEEYKLVEFTGQQIFNFSYEFCLPCYDTELENMIRERDEAEYDSYEKDFARVTAITERIYKLGGRNLFWS